MAVSKAQQRAVTKYDAKAYDKTLLRLSKGKLDVVRAHAAARGESVNGFIGRAIASQMDRDGGGIPAGGPQEAAGSGMVSLPLETEQAAQRAAERTGETVAGFISRAVDTQAQRDKSSLRLDINPATGERLNQSKEEGGGREPV